MERNEKYTLGLYEKSMPDKLSLQEKLSAAKAAGFDFMEISIDETIAKLARLDMTMENRKELLAYMSSNGIPIRTMCLSGHRKFSLGSNDNAVAARGMEIMEKAIAFAEDLGIRIIQLAGYDVYYEPSTEETRSRFAKNLKRAVKLAASAGVVLGFETMETEFLNTVEKAMYYIGYVNSPYLQIYPDIGNLTNASILYNANPKTDMQKGAGHLVALHLKETLPGVFREVPFGEGHVEFEVMIKTAWNLGVRKFVAEFWYTGNENWKDELGFVNRMMTAILEKGKEALAGENLEDKKCWRS